MQTSHVDTLFTELAGIYGARFTSAWGQYDKSGVWERELALYTPEMLTNGLRRCRQQARDAAHAGETAWPPQPIEFAALCDPRPEDMGLPGADAAWREAIRHCHAPHAHHWSHDAVRIAGRHVGWEDIHQCRVMNGESAERRFYAQYKTLTRKAMRGEALTPQHLLEADHMKRPAVVAELAGRERAGQRAQRFRNAGTGNQALSAMRSMLCTA